MLSLTESHWRQDSSPEFTSVPLGKGTVAVGNRTHADLAVGVDGKAPPGRALHCLRAYARHRSAPTDSDAAGLDGAPA